MLLLYVYIYLCKFANYAQKQLKHRRFVQSCYHKYYVHVHFISNIFQIPLGARSLRTNNLSSPINLIYYFRLSHPPIFIATFVHYLFIFSFLLLSLITRREHRKIRLDSRAFIRWFGYKIEARFDCAALARITGSWNASWWN